MIKIKQKQSCSGCGACANACPKQCIAMVEGDEGFLYPQVDVVKCIDCGLCEKVCPIINKWSSKHTPIAYACINKNENIRLESSSGGVFTIIGENTINSGGVVFGAAYNDELKLVHSYAITIEGLAKYRGSKYEQSIIGETYKQAKEFLHKGIPVLYTGTPCQIGGLYSYLGKEYEKLLCIDIVCHGVPSPKVFKRYKAGIEDRYGAKIKKIAFRRKDAGWKLYNLELSFDNNTEYKNIFTEDMYMRGFLQNLYLRPSCYYCSFKTIYRQSDITIADFWGIENILPEIDDDKGTSLILVNSTKGNKVFEELQDKMVVEKVDLDEAIKYNPSAVTSVKYNPNRDKFFEKLNSYSGDISKLILQYTKISFPKRVCRKIRAILSKVKRKLVH
ncbi:Coenzyme F420 hydrogenase/dehydrogenase, beta subunit C-terminal domain [Clostridium lacusfryxellense]|uniref:Coenzyme F420 hydrogenase/dehydrogenase, beta subunit C-terminal domain n=1 Tax=Clostridium lacusfryxellense TaxID=205328 RepID=UPI001C0B67F6|nr:Coenzyme F420 hydrogenase/dehydrogenase, beta subunit C-terminal domain [Clostridium lacusfryxellense]MBU3111061.1 Coenzyme F420 hydrogenase/dehydrogenase, beta subunit C-terminal domain [Clostridium lacusfryxellense]